MSHFLNVRYSLKSCKFYLCRVQVKGVMRTQYMLLSLTPFMHPTPRTPPLSPRTRPLPQRTAPLPPPPPPLHSHSTPPFPQHRAVVSDSVGLSSFPTLNRSPESRMTRNKCNIISHSWHLIFKFGPLSKTIGESVRHGCSPAWRNANVIIRRRDRNLYLTNYRLLYSKLPHLRPLQIKGQKGTNQYCIRSCTFQMLRYI